MTNVGNSVFSKILLASLLVFAGLFAILDYGINELFYANQLESKKAELELESLLLVTSASIDNNQIIIPEELEETRFDALNTGLYGYISNADQQLLWQSYSSQSIAIAPENLKPENTSITSFYYRLGYFVFIHTVTWELEEDKPQEIYFVVVENASPTILARDNFQKKIRYRLIISAIVFFAALLVILRLGSQPLFKLTHEIKEIEAGSLKKTTGNYPIELSPLSENINQLLSAEHNQRERFRTTLADLSHSLKTPLALIQNELNNTHPDKNQLQQQLSRMNDIIQHQLQRAVLSHPSQRSESHQLSTVVNDLDEALTKVYRDKHVSLNKSFSQDILFKGDPHDLMEILGNILDNAWKNCTANVRINAVNNHRGLTIEIHDDGIGIPETKRNEVLSRGGRLDSQTPGQGIGLDITQDIVASYGGQLSISDSELGGALFTIFLPV